MTNNFMAHIAVATVYSELKIDILWLTIKFDLAQYLYNYVRSYILILQNFQCKVKSYVC